MTRREQDVVEAARAYVHADRAALRDDPKVSRKKLVDALLALGAAVDALDATLADDRAQRSTTCPVCGADLTKDPHRPPCMNVKP